MKNRTYIKIMANVLEATGMEPSGVGVSRLIRAANLSYGRLLQLLRDLVKGGLVETVSHQGITRYRITPAGERFLTEYKKFEELAESFGLRL
jgi:predicted transcriptional regulator